MEESKKPVLEKKKVKTLTEAYDDFFKIGERVPKLLSNEKLKKYVLKSKENAEELYRALTSEFTWRYSAGIVAEIKGVGGYTDYYCCGKEGSYNRKINRYLKRSDIVLSKNYTWSWIMNKTIWKIRWNRSNKMMDLVLKIDKNTNKKKQERIMKKFDRLHIKTKRRIDKWDKKENKKVKKDD